MAESFIGSWRCELSRSQSLDEVASSDLPRIFQGSQDGINRGEASRNIFSGDGFASDNPHAVEQLPGLFHLSFCR